MRPKYLAIGLMAFLAAACNQVPAQSVNQVNQNPLPVQTPAVPAKPLESAPQGQTSSSAGQSSGTSGSINMAALAKATPPASSSALSSASADPLAGLGGTKFSDGILPLGDYKYTTTQPEKGYVFLCRAQTGGGGAQGNPTWITGNTWNINGKINVEGSVSWPNASYKMTISGTNRIITTNDLPNGQTTGIFPISASDPAHAIDANPNTITAQNFTFTLPANPTESATPNCMGGEVGVMTTGVVLFNAFDAGGRDAAAHEVQDHCQAHPQESGIYHYHSLSSCISNPTVTNVIGYAFDGFPITGPSLGNGKYLTTADLDECHGITSQITLDGRQVTMYHYVMTEDFPYSVSCFRGKNTLTGPLGGTSQQSANSSQQTGNGQQTLPQAGTPPQAAITACSGQTAAASCSFTTPNGTISGTCQTPPGQSTLACVPQQ